MMIEVVGSMITMVLIPIMLEGSKWLPCNELILGSSARNVMAVDNGGRRTEGEETKEISKGSSGRSNWLTRLLNFGTEDAKAVFTALSVTILFWSSLAEPRSIPTASMYPTLDVGDRVLAEKLVCPWVHHHRKPLLNRNDASWNLLYAAAGEVVRIRMTTSNEAHDSSSKGILVTKPTTILVTKPMACLGRLDHDITHFNLCVLNGLLLTGNQEGILVTRAMASLGSLDHDIPDFNLFEEKNRLQYIPITSNSWELVPVLPIRKNGKQILVKWFPLPSEVVSLETKGVSQSTRTPFFPATEPEILRENGARFKLTPGKNSPWSSGIRHLRSSLQNLHHGSRLGRCLGSNPMGQTPLLEPTSSAATAGGGVEL
ncbi:hypothetical protein Vadar_023224 [Vaccinium darrowii]|uniref:Uncharacterized protein n=1 Tax=Vaccinium darrowii TaxID=229202 RepID=A0ACB7ZLA3_9ERIC|nr:hypothetical protein Vadar_023224 [Vaccinium darrowii]